ncbi:MAG: TonB-dependent receptor plug domain-containing protein [Gemmatimonas sp.]|nr:TonB-dependent receptor plug domain-containing protein [Gemmatimonas sp.]MCZ8206368.1 TonB-dependent receptor plug domain-containing protein [Gemmatimonas sp.]
MKGFLVRKHHLVLLGWSLAGLAAAGDAAAQIRPDPAGHDSLRTTRSLLDSVRVTASQPRALLDGRSRGLGGAIEARELTALPTDARDPISLLYNIPGITQATGFFGDAPRLSFNGGNALYSSYLLDGLDNNEGFLGGPRVDLPLGAIARMDALVNGYSAAFGRSPDGVVNVTSQPGGRARGGDLFVYQRPGRPLDARLPVTFGAVPQALNRRQEGFERLQAGGSYRTASASGRTLVGSALEYTSEQEDRIGSTAQAQFLGTEHRQTVKGYLRVDHGWSPTQTTTLRLAGSGVDRAGNGSGVVTPEADIRTRRIGTLSALTHRSTSADGRGTHTLSAQFGTYHWYFPPVRSDFSQPQVTIVTPDRAVQAVVGSSNFVFDERERQIQLRDVVERDLSRTQRVRAGADVVHARFALAAASTNPNGAYTVVNDGNIAATGGRPLSIRDVPAEVRVLSYTVDARPQQVNLTQTMYGAFAEHEWLPTPRLAVTTGIRWDYDDLTSRGESAPDLDNIQPRVATTWQRSPRDLVRASIGRHAGRFPYAIYSDAIQLGASGNAVLTYEGASAPAFRAGQLPAQISASEIQSVPREIFRTFAVGLEQPMSWQSAVGYQRQIGTRWSMSADVVWSETRNLPWLADLNPIARRLTAADTTPRFCASAFSCPGDASRPNVPATSGYRRESTAQSGGSARYQALYVAVRRARSDRWTLDGNWVWSRARNNTEDFNFSATQGNCFARSGVDAITGASCTSDEWADANNDRRHRLTLRTTATPVRRLSLGAIVDAQTGVPVNRLAGRVAADGSIARYDLLGSGPIRGNGFIGNGDRFFGVGRNTERLPGSVTLGVSAVGRPLAQRAPGLEVRLDVFNALNSLVWGGYANGIGGGGSRTQFGRPGDPIELFAAGPPRQFQLSLRFAFGSATVPSTP